MDKLPWYLMSIGFYIVVFSIPTSLSFISFKFLKKFTNNEKFYLLALIPALIFGYIIKATSIIYWIIQLTILIYLSFIIRKRLLK